MLVKTFQRFYLITQNEMLFCESSIKKSTSKLSQSYVYSHTGLSATMYSVQYQMMYMKPYRVILPS